MERAKKFQLKADPDIMSEEVIDNTLAKLKILLEDNGIDVTNFAITTFKHITNQLGKKNNLYFHGPPSTGKTMIMESLCDVNFNVSRLTGLTPNSQFNFASVYNTNACFMDECKLTDNQFEQWKLLAGGSKMDTDIKYKDRLMVVDCRLYTASNHQLGLYVQTEGAAKAIAERTTQFDFFKPDEAVDLPLCINGEMLMFKMELVREAVEKAPTLLGEKRSRRHAKKRQVKAETTLKQSWSSDEFYQVISDGDGIELTVRVAKNRIPPKNEKQLNMPVSNNNTTTSSPTTTTTTRMMPSAAAAKETVITSTTTKKPNLLSEDCLQYKYMIEQMERSGSESSIKLLEDSCAVSGQ
ncbi:hypothetical protein MSG28_011794 [Choristoneura fumiferana]|uniref:Uncharacterized protein n=1 Tax=Choristoneura fumiferana TaxID=7141 RepID=A0ACC0KML6_CHOFU|nr:hypothetical protein MSG28_011794 [Choristoneura fumiferana]